MLNSCGLKMAKAVAQLIAQLLSPKTGRNNDDLKVEKKNSGITELYQPKSKP